MFYTLGQRQGLGIGGLTDFSEAPWYVVDKDITRNVLIVAQQHDHPRLLNQTLHCMTLDWVSAEPPVLPLRCTAKIRYRCQDEICTITDCTDGQYRVEFDAPQRAITPGQSVVFYQDEICLGGAVIT